MGRGKHFIGDFLPPDELEKFMETFKALKVRIPGILGLLHAHPTKFLWIARHSCRKKGIKFPLFAQKWGNIWGKIPALGGNGVKFPKDPSLEVSEESLERAGIMEVSLPMGLDGLKGLFPLWNSRIWDFSGIPDKPPTGFLFGISGHQAGKTWEFSSG